MRNKKKSEDLKNKIVEVIDEIINGNYVDKQYEGTVKNKLRKLMESWVLKKYGDKIEKEVLSIVEKEWFIDSVIKRINRKQLK